MKVSAACLGRIAGLTLLLAPALAAAAAPAGRYTASGGVVKDNKTGLFWQQAAEGQTYIFADAVAYCAGNVAALPGTGWRVPAIKELQTLVDDSIPPPGPTIDATAFPATPAAGFWSSTLYATGASHAWTIEFNRAIQTDAPMTGSMYAVRCVR
jgi:hypothetical protein